MKALARGRQGALERSKTSGRDKKVKLLPVSISREAWISEEWLEAGAKLLQTPELGFERDYLLPLPNGDLSGSCGLRAEYADALGLTRQLWCTLECPGTEEALMLPEAALFWSEHSDRAGFASWLPEAS